MKKIYSFLLKLLGWTYELAAPIPPKCVICVAPHTSNWDFVIGMIFYKSIGGNPHFLMKKSWFVFPLNYIFRAFGGFPIDRSKNSSMTDQMAEEFNRQESFQLAITPEGTRKKNSNWKTGFYYIATHAKVPIALASLDYSIKKIRLIENFIPTGDVDKDMDYIKLQYKGVLGKYPDKFSM
ncbi:1-acyl-sn-glycerol-3-phosphate acyltransferase [Dysgonomonadaceae bacterium PH5-43]|nr:1-acyl-sn-glycerol-3-phosphate acyltransferase [Dysgonomonadaceae bacterium PH5-43]